MIHAKDDGNTLLHFASRVGNIFLIRKLLQQGEDINAKNRAGQTALDIAEQYQKSDVIMELSRHGAQRKAVYNRLAGIRRATAQKSIGDRGVSPKPEEIGQSAVTP